MGGENRQLFAFELVYELLRELIVGDVGFLPLLG
ncbi:hypothetical protein HNP81_002389 [Peribacillus huizhouensis]|uniref:Uncharacterized protein n=1 Tax=Peribacillus huizhouensis TaxID=1501239 RepID=A0ABR6CQ75_9BACI|nr:hypothetical protein [Peribacillus huizhouensis]